MNLKIAEDLKEYQRIFEELKNAEKKLVSAMRRAYKSGSTDGRGATVNRLDVIHEKTGLAKSYSSRVLSGKIEPGNAETVIRLANGFIAIPFFRKARLPRLEK